MVFSRIWLSPLFVFLPPGSESNWLTVSSGSSEVAAHKRMAKSLICMELIKGQPSLFTRFFSPFSYSLFLFLSHSHSLTLSLLHTHTLSCPLVSNVCVCACMGVSSIPLTSNWCKWKEWRRLGEGWPCYNRGGSPQLITRSLPRCFRLINSSSELKKKKKSQSKVLSVVQPLRWLRYLLRTYWSRWELRVVRAEQRAVS